MNKETLYYPKNNIRVTNLYRETHPGLDFGGVRIGDANVYGMGEGVVTNVGIGVKFGKFVIVYYPTLDVSGLFLHFKDVLVNEGDNVTCNTVIGYEGDTGNARGAHLHLGLYKGKYKTYWNNFIDPSKYLYVGEWQKIYKGEYDNLLDNYLIDEYVHTISELDVASSTLNAYKEKLIEIRDAINEIL